VLYVHYAAAYAALFTLSGDVVNVMGRWWKGRDEIQHKLDAALHRERSGGSNRASGKSLTY
jgi:hypothetical protein